MRDSRKPYGGYAQFDLGEHARNQKHLQQMPSSFHGIFSYLWEFTAADLRCSGFLHGAFSCYGISHGRILILGVCSVDFRR